MGVEEKKDAGHEFHVLVDDKEDDVGDSKPKTKKSLSFGRLMAQAKPERCILTVGTIALFMTALMQLTIPAWVGTIIDCISGPDVHSKTNTELTKLIIYLGLAHDQQSLLEVAGIGFGSVILIGAIFSFARGTLFTLAGERVVARLRRELFWAIISQDIAFFDETRTGELTNRLAADTTILKDACTINISMGLRQLTTMIGGIVYLFIMSYKLTLVMLGIVPLVAISARCYGMKLRTLSKKTQDALARATEVAEESCSNIRTMKAFSREDLQSMLYNEKIDETYRLGARQAVLYGSFIALIGIFGQGAMVVVLYYGATLVLQGSLSPGTLTSFVLYTLTIAGSLAGLSGIFAEFMKAQGANERVFEIIDRVPAINISGGTTLDQMKGHVKLTDVNFRYPSRPKEQVLSGLNLELRSGTVTALVGPSGGGKSTIVSLIERFYDIVQGDGSITIDGTEVRDLDPKWMHQHIGIITQDPVLFCTSIRDNITYGVKSATQAEIEIAAKAAHAHNFILTFNEGYDTLVGERGVRLSGGQKQRIAIARAILMNPKILIADEATSSLDAESEHIVQKALDSVMDGRTVLVVAHRLSTVKNADNVCVITDGQVVEQGTHDELLLKDAAYAKLVHRQLQHAPTSLSIIGKEEP